MGGDCTNRGKVMSRAAFGKLWFDQMLSLAQIGQMLGISGAAVSWRGAALGFPQRHSGGKARYDRDGDLFVRMWLANVRLDEMARYFGVQPGAIAANARRRGLARRWARLGLIGLAEFAEVELANQMSASAADDCAAHAARDLSIRAGMRGVRG